MILSNSTLLADTSVTANYRAWTQWIDSSIVALGWTRGTDTGQVDLTTITGTTTSAVVGYKIYKSADAYTQLYAKVEYACTGSNGQPGIYVTVGTGTDGAGSITGTLLVRTQAASNAFSTSTAQYCYISGDGSSFRIAMFNPQSGTAIFSFVYTVERRRTSSGAIADTGAYMVTNSSGTVSNSRTGILGATTQPSVETGLVFLLSTTNPTNAAFTPGVGITYPQVGGIMDPPALNVAVFNSLDFTAYSTFTCTVYGVSHTYLALGGSISNVRSNNTDSNTRLAILWE